MNNNNNILLIVLAVYCHGEIISFATKHGTKRLNMSVWKVLSIVCGCHLLQSCHFSGFVNILYFALFVFLFIALFIVYDMYVLPSGVIKNNNTPSSGAHQYSS